MMDYPLQISEDFEPQTRARSNTWPLPRPEDNNNSSGSSTNIGNGAVGNNGEQPEGILGAGGQPFLPKKSTSRRNAWGNMSYADLITQAIGSSPDKRLTLSQIYDWMVTNVPYFKDKGDSNSSAGWKNSIRHNLSLHNRFMRVQNEGTGKSSWWMLNPDAKPGKAARRRATSMETSKYEKKRGRIRKKIEAMRNGTTLLDTPSPSSSINEGLDVYPDSPQVPLNFQLSPDFRPRASSNASSCGRLSPILCVSESGVDLHDNQVPPMSPWSSLDYNNLPPFSNHNSYSNNSAGNNGTGTGAAANAIDRFATDQLAGSLANTMKLNSTDCFTDFGVSPTFLPFNFTTNNSNSNSNNSQRREDPPDYFNYLQHEKLHQQPTPPPSQQQQPSHPELDFNLEQLGQFDCDVEQVLQNELNLGGDIDFNFAGVNHLHNNVTPTTTSVSQLQVQPPPDYPVGMSSSGVVHHQATPPAAAVLGRNWVH